MSYGNVSEPRANEQYFRRAIALLREAVQTGHVLEPHMQRYKSRFQSGELELTSGRYLDEFGRLVD